MKKFIVLLFIVVLVFPLIVFARVGVGMGVGNIRIDKLKPGGIYDLPFLVVYNTGDGPSDYEITISYHVAHPEIRPLPEWFTFTPSPFRLEPGKSQRVAVKLTLPVKGVEPGDYFCFLEAHPIMGEGEPGTVTIGVAAATKLYFSVIPANIWQAMYYRFLALWRRYVPWNWIVLALVLAATAILIFRKIFRKHFSLQIGIKKKEEPIQVKKPRQTRKRRQTK